MSVPSREGERMGCWRGVGPHSSQGNDVGRNRLSDLQTAVCSESLLIPGQRKRLEPAGEGLLWGDPGEVWRDACRDRGCWARPLSAGPWPCVPSLTCVPPLLFSIPCSLQEFHELIYTTSLYEPQKGASVQNLAH